MNLQGDIYIFKYLYLYTQCPLIYNSHLIQKLQRIIDLFIKCKAIKTSLRKLDLGLGKEFLDVLSNGASVKE